MQELEKILEEIEIKIAGSMGKKREGLLEAHDIIRNHMDDGWIPVDDRLPEEGEKVLVWYEYFRYGEYNRMYETYGISWQYDGYWSGDVSGIKAKCIAWQPLPEPYRPEQPETCKYIGGSCCWPIDQCGECPNHPERSEGE